MKREKALAELKERVACAKYVNEEYADMVDVNALEVAIEALKAEPCEDCISREDALMALTGEWTELTDEVIHRFIKRVKNLPPMVLPKPIECDDCVSRQAVEDAIYDYSRSCDVNYAQIMKYIEKIPSVTPAEKVGHWIMHIDDLFPTESTMECNRCHEHQPITIDDNYCPNCGAKMQEVEE